MLAPAEIVQQILHQKGQEPSTEAAEAFAPVNIALIKYWGKRSRELNLPQTSSLSISLGEKGTHTRIRLAERDHIELNGTTLCPEDPFSKRLSRYLDYFRGPEQHAYHIQTTNSVPTAAGLASSASGFAALVLALDKLYGWYLGGKELSILARLGSGSASRSIYHGFVLWHAGENVHGMDSFAEPLHTEWPDLRVGLLELDSGKKGIGSRDAMNRTTSESVLYQAWPDKVAGDLQRVLRALEKKDFVALGEVAESNAMSMHATMLGTMPPICYWLPESVRVLQEVWRLRAQGLPLFVTMDAGPNIKLLFEAQTEQEVLSHFPDCDMIRPFG